MIRRALILAALLAGVGCSAPSAFPPVPVAAPPAPHSPDDDFNAGVHHLHGDDVDGDAARYLRAHPKERVVAVTGGCAPHYGCDLWVFTEMRGALPCSTKGE